MKFLFPFFGKREPDPVPTEDEYLLIAWRATPEYQALRRRVLARLVSLNQDLLHSRDTSNIDRIDELTALVEGIEQLGAPRLPPEE